MKNKQFSAFDQLMNHEKAAYIERSIELLKSLLPSADFLSIESNTRILMTVTHEKSATYLTESQQYFEAKEALIHVYQQKQGFKARDIEAGDPKYPHDPSIYLQKVINGTDLFILEMIQEAQYLRELPAQTASFKF